MTFAPEIKLGEDVTVPLPNTEELAKCRIVRLAPGEAPWVSFCGMEPFQAEPMTLEDVLLFEEQRRARAS